MQRRSVLLKAASSNLGRLSSLPVMNGAHHHAEKFMLNLYCFWLYLGIPGFYNNQDIRLDNTWY
jgi:hypothetical protein